jgi:hypothetical protein
MDARNGFRIAVPGHKQNRNFACFSKPLSCLYPFPAPIEIYIYQDDIRLGARCSFDRSLGFEARPQTSKPNVQERRFQVDCDQRLIFDSQRAAGHFRLPSWQCPPYQPYQRSGAAFVPGILIVSL